MSALEAALEFVRAINAHDVAGLANLMTEDHVFIDALGHTVWGEAALRQAWNGYFRSVPDYAIEIHHAFADDSIVALFGRAGGTWSNDGMLHPENVWEIPWACRVVVRSEQIAEWRIYCDNEPLRQIMARS